jgi:hypothetical protein
MNYKPTFQRKQTTANRPMTPSRPLACVPSPEGDMSSQVEATGEQDTLEAGRMIRQGVRSRRWANDAQMHCEVIVPVRQSRRGATE